MAQNPVNYFPSCFLTLLGLGLLAVWLLSGCSTNGRPMRFNPDGAAGSSPGRSWYIEGKAPDGEPVSCSFVEFDERGDFLDFVQHRDCEARIQELIRTNKVLLIMYCHGWKNNSQSGNVAEFNAFLGKLAQSSEIRQRGLRVHGIYLGWRGNSFPPYIDTSTRNESYQQTLTAYGQAIVDSQYYRRWYWPLALPEIFSYWSRKRAAEHLVSGLPMARAIFTYAAGAKGYGTNMDNPVCVMGHSFGALMLERSLGQGLTGQLTMEWWQAKDQAQSKIGMPFDLILLVNSAAPAIYAKELRDFLEAHRSALARKRIPTSDAPVVISLTSTADWATGVVHPIGNVFASVEPSLQRRYTNGIFSEKTIAGEIYPSHQGIRQSEFYTRTPGHQPYLINHWIVKADSEPLPSNPTPDVVFSANLATNVADPNVFFTSKAKFPAAAWRLTQTSPGKPVVKDGLIPAMPNSDYWIVSCGKELIGGHNDVWSTTTMELYAGLFRAASSRRK